MCMFLDCGRKLARTLTGAGGTRKFHVPELHRGVIIYKWASCSSNFKAWAFKHCSYVRNDKVLSAGAEDSSKDSAAFTSTGHFLCNNHIRALTFRNIANPNIRISIKVSFFFFYRNTELQESTLIQTVSTLKIQNWLDKSRLSLYPK